MRKVGLLGGSFDPIHLGHITLALSLLEAYCLDEVLFSPAFCSPFKKKNPPLATPQQRLEMVRLSIEPIAQFSVWVQECATSQESFTIDTVRTILKEREGITLHLLLAGELLERFSEWKEVDKLIQLAPPLVGVFSGKIPTCSFPQTPVPHLEISSTEIRRRLSSGLYCGHLLPDPVWRYIQTHRLYR